MSVFKESTSYRPFTYPQLMEAAKKHSIDMYWDVHSVELQDDIRQYKNLASKTNSHEVNLYILDTLICLFTELDKTVAEGYITLLPYIKNNEARCWLLTAAQREVVHQRGYAMLAEALSFSSAQWANFQNFKEMVSKLNVMTSHKAEDGVVDSKPLQAAKILTTILLGEGIGLFAAFTCLLNYKRQGHLMGFNDVNQWSLLDEQEHVDNNIKLLKSMLPDLQPNEETKLVDFTFDKVEQYRVAEYDYIDLITKNGNPEDLTKQQLYSYIDFLCAYRLQQLGLLSEEDNPQPTNPIPWMGWMLSGLKHDSFFEKKVTDYTHIKLPGSVSYGKYLN